MGAAPNRCPVCGEVLQWKLVDTSNKGFSVERLLWVPFCLAPLVSLAERWARKSRPTTAASADFTTNIKT